MASFSFFSYRLLVESEYKTQKVNQYSRSELHTGSGEACVKLSSVNVDSKTGANLSHSPTTGPCLIPYSSSRSLISCADLLLSEDIVSTRSDRLVFHGYFNVWMFSFKLQVSVSARKRNNNQTPPTDNGRELVLARGTSLCGVELRPGSVERQDPALVCLTT